MNAFVARAPIDFLPEVCVHHRTGGSRVAVVALCIGFVACGGGDAIALPVDVPIPITPTIDTTA